MTTLLERNVALASVVTYPIRDDGLLIDEPRVGQLTGFRGNELTFELTGRVPVSKSVMLVGVDQPDGSRAYVGVVLSRDTRGSDLRIIGAVRGGIGERILTEDGRVPVLHEGRYRFERAFSDDIYASWEQAGILRRRVLDRVLVCPKCAALPTFRFACQRCGSGDTQQALMVHHFACACVAPLETFEGEVSLKCPKCQTKHLIAGTDFEYSPGEHVCQDCGWKSRELEQTGHCLNCETRFPIHQAVEQELVGYDADRLDALALVPHMG